MNTERIRKQCDRCNAHNHLWWDNHSECDQHARESGWYVDAFQDVCPSCLRDEQEPVESNELRAMLQNVGYLP